MGGGISNWKERMVAMREGWIKIAKMKAGAKKEDDRSTRSFKEQAGRKIDLLKDIPEVTAESMVSGIKNGHKKNGEMR